MTDLLAYLPGILMLLIFSGFFSGSEAAFFSLTPSQRRKLAQGNPTDRVASALLSRSERLLMGILFWNLAINIAYFSLASKAALVLGESDTSGRSVAMVGIVALLTIIVVGEFLPKSIAVTYPMAVVRVVVFPLAGALRLVDFFLPMLKVVNEASRRLVWPGFKSEAYLDLGDLDRAVALSTEDAQLFDQESQVLRNVIRLSEIRAEEWMRPRTEYRTFTPPVSLSQLGGERTPSGYMLVTDAQGRDVVSVIDLSDLPADPDANLTPLQKPLVPIPWCASIADALKTLHEQGRRVAVIVNEYGETVGILTWEEIIEAVLHGGQESSHPELAKADVRPDANGGWLASGRTKLRRLERVLDRRINVARGLTIAGVLQEHLHRLPESGDRLEFDQLSLEVIEAGVRGELLVRIQILPEEPGGEA